MAIPRAAFEIGGHAIAAGRAETIDLPVIGLYTRAPVSMPVRVLHGRRDGPVMFVSAALHGDEIMGVEILRRLLRLPALRRLSGTLLAVPVVNTLAFLQHSRYLPDGRDLNRSFPGSETGSLAARVAHHFLKAVVGRCHYGIDLHTGAQHRPNLPQIRADLSHPESLRLAHAFGAPLLLDSEPTPGTLRAFTTRREIPVLLYEASEALRFDEAAIRIGVQGICNVLSALGMIAAPPRAPRTPPVVAISSTWVRAPASGVLRSSVELGAQVRRGMPLGVVGDPLGEREVGVTATASGVVIGRSRLPLVHEGDALFHIARLDQDNAASVQRRMRAEGRGRRPRRERATPDE